MGEPTDRNIQFMEFCEFFFNAWLNAQGFSLRELGDEELQQKVDAYVIVCFEVARAMNSISDSLEEGLGVTGMRINFDVMQQSCLRAALLLKASDWTRVSLPDDGSTGAFLKASINAFSQWLQEQPQTLMAQLSSGETDLIEAYVAHRTTLAADRGIDFPEGTQKVLSTFLHHQRHQPQE